MARISLRAYSRDIEVMIDKNQIDEAFAHCRYILELYPKHIDTYRLMGKALLEAQRFSDASDVFHRVLSSVPDDFIAHLGMSIIREDESNLDAAIWHMERSFEVQPSNAAVQVELRRLYGLRDGVTPQKIQLTRGALARMSAKSNLYSQAIAELRSALSNDPQRPDLQVVLAEMYLQTGSRMEAIETCNALINKLPYCLTANRILAEVLPETERADQAHEYKTRLGELDPYYLQLSPVALTLDQVPDGAVTIERFEYTGESFEHAESDQPAWAATLGVDLDDEQSTSDEPAPDWIEAGETQPEMVPPVDFEEDSETSEDEEQMKPAEEKEGGPGELPDWMNGLDDPGAEEAPAQDVKAEQPFEDAEEIEGSRQFTSLVDAEEAVEEVPDWMREVDEAEEQDDTSPVPGIAAAVGAAAVGAVIAGQEDEQVESESEPEQEAEQAAADAIQEEDEPDEPLPDWMASTDEEEEPLAAEEPDDLPEESPAFEPGDVVEEEIPGVPGDQEGAEQLPEWMSEAEPAAEDEAPEWLKDAMESPDDESDAPPTAAALAAGAAILSAEDADETAAVAETGLEEETPLTTEPEFETADQAADGDMPDLTAGEDAPKGSADDDSPEEEAPEEAGLTAGEAAIAGAAAVVGASLVKEDEMPTEAVDEAGLPAADELTPLIIEDEGIGEADEDIPDWLQDLGEDMPTAGETEEPPVVFEDQPADDEPGSEMEIEPGTEDIESEAVLETATADDKFSPGELPVEQAEPYEESDFPESIPVWLSEVSPDEIPEEVAEAEAELDIVRAEIPVWLRKMEDQHKAEMESADEVESVEELELDAEFTELSGEDVPSWLMSAMEPELPPEVDEIPEVEDIRDVFAAQDPVEIGELGLEDSRDEEPEPGGLEEVDGVLESAELQEESVSLEVSPEAQIESDDAAGEAIDEQVVQEDELMQPGTEVVLSEEVAEEIVPGEDLEPEMAEGEDEGLGLPGLAAAGAAAVAAADLLDDEDTQPIAVADEPAHPGELEPEEIPGEPALEAGEDLLEVGDDTEEQVLEPEGELPLPVDVEEAEVPALADDAPLSGEEEDAAMAWLESLAAKQGASEEELLTPADQRLEQPPEWVQEESSEVEPQQDEDIEARDTALTAAALAGVTAGMLAEHDETEDVDTAGEEGQETEDLLEEPSEWMPEVIEEQELVPGAESEGSGIEPEALEIEEPAGVVEQADALAEADLEQAETEDIPEEIPDWLSGLAEEQEGTLETEADGWTPDMLAEEVEEPAARIDAAPPEKIDLNAASLSQLERIPGIGFIFAQNIVSHRAESGSFTDLEQLGEVEGISPDMVADLSDYLTVEVVTEISPSKSETPELQDAWDGIAEGNIEKAVDQYTDLIDQDQHLDEIIRDLQSAINKYPSDSALYQCLGDAYMHSNMLQEALDAYNRAEDLI